MNSIRCPQCGLQNWETSEWCKRCKLTLKSNQNFSASSANNSQTNQSHSQTNYRPETPNNGRRNPQTHLPCDEINGFTAKNIKRGHRNILIVCGLIISTLLGGLLLNSRYFYNAVFGPFTVSQKDLINGRIQTGTFHYFVKITAEDVYDTGTTYVETSKKYRTETVKYKYVALQLEDKLFWQRLIQTRIFPKGRKIFW